MASDAPPDCSSLPNDHEETIVVPGFAIMAVCCLLADTLQSFREEPKRTTTNQFREFLKRPAFGGEFANEKVAEAFVNGVRHGIFHDAETRGWVIRRGDPPGRIVEPRAKGYVLNRGEFYRALKSEFAAYIQELRDGLNADLRARFVGKMDDIVGRC